MKLLILYGRSSVAAPSRAVESLRAGRGGHGGPPVQNIGCGSLAKPVLHAASLYPLELGLSYARILQADSECTMYNTKKLFVNIAGVLAVSIIGAILMMALDSGGTRWLKFILYILFFASTSPAVFSSHLSCSSMLHHLRKRS